MSLYSAAGNRFAVLDAFERVPENPAGLARVLCARLSVDGLLLGCRPSSTGDCRMQVINRDGSKAEACGNGLRALARWAFESGHAGEEMLIETDAGPRRVRCEVRDGAVVGARAELGVPRLVEADVALALDGREVRVTQVDMGNPHCVVFVPDVEAAPVAQVGAALEVHARFLPQRTNVSFVEVQAAGSEAPRLRARTWERGVGETEACGTGAGAAAVAAMRQGHAHSPVVVSMRGGELCIEWDGAGPLTLAGPVQALSTS